MQSDAVPHGYPRPQLVRSASLSLDGDWQFALDADARHTSPADVDWARSIVVPFAPETRVSGVGDDGFYRACWYRRSITIPGLRGGERLVLNFCAVGQALALYAKLARVGFEPCEVVDSNAALAVSDRA